MIPRRRPPHGAARRVGLALALTLTLGGCAPNGPVEPPDGHALGLLSARPGPAGACFAPGRHILDVGATREPIAYLPSGYDAGRPLPLVVLFHGAGGSAESWQSPYDHADRLGLALLLIQSREATWDLLLDGWGADIAATDRAMQALFDRCAIDPGRVGFGGFSDGASYALSLALSNGELVRRVIAFSPGFERGARRDPKPRVFISHGTADRILPIGLTGRRIAERLEEAGYDVTFLEFEGGHEVPPAVSRAAFDWLAR